MTKLRSSSQFYSQYQSFSGADYSFTFYIPLNATSDQVGSVRQKIKAEMDNISPLDYYASITQDLNKPQFSSPQFEALKKLDSMLQKFQNQSVPMKMDSIQTLSFQIHTDIQPVRALKFKYPRGYCVGQRLIAGSIIATVLNEHPFQEIMEFNNLFRYLLSGGNADFEQRRLLEALSGVDESSSVVDEIPPFNILIDAMNEGGDGMTSSLIGVKLINDGVVISSQDMITEQTFSFVAQDVDLFRNTRRGERNTATTLLNYRSGVSILNNESAKAKRQFKRGFNL